MKLFKKPYSFIKSFWEYLGQSQDKNFRILHIVVGMAVILQIIDSNFMHVKFGLNAWAYLHMFCGLSLCALSVLLVIMALDKRGLRYYFPYLYNDYSAIKLDLSELRKLKLPNSRSGSLAAIVQGLGLLALTIAWVSGFFWFTAWNWQSPYMHDLEEIHKTLVDPVEIYIYAHAFMGILHYVLQRYFPQFISEIKAEG
ncbi:cytochrome b/b6 domain-containing protein [Francisella sp. LA112445]|uniref:cytochrome b/b6 domain-containing protein n=1 Tax=Francisella sp. LA112445 TaxID=1395624 RepID=UPI001788CB5E|nr:cytochrome b/b6 domain-containing protein [Francisella sp. LA112445]QIW09978.1 cytochrome b/b6 domain-containing protein [Francisella sp. LA112445]